MFDYDPSTRLAVPNRCQMRVYRTPCGQLRTPDRSRLRSPCRVRGRAAQRLLEGMRLPAAAEGDSEDFLHAMRARRDALAAELDRMDADLARFSQVASRRPDPESSRVLLNISQAARYLGLSRGTVHELIRRGELILHDVGMKRPLLIRSEVEACLAASRAVVTSRSAS